jgi:hypothetical protein
MDAQQLCVAGTRRFVGPSGPDGVVPGRGVASRSPTVLVDAIEIAANRIAVMRQAVDAVLDPLGLLLQECCRLRQAVRVDCDLARMLEERQDTANDVCRETGVEPLLSLSEARKAPRGSVNQGVCSDEPVQMIGALSLAGSLWILSTGASAISGYFDPARSTSDT